MGVAEHPQPPLLEVEGLTLEFPVGGARVRVVSGVSFAVGAGEILGLVGTSGSGKTMTALALFRLVPPPGRIAAGRIRIAGADLLELGREPLRRLRGGRIALVPQDPAAGFDPLFPVGAQIAEVARAHRDLSRKAARAEALRLLSRAGLAGPERVAASYPHQLSGGQRQRAAIAAALAGSPRVLVADEPTSALDATVQAQVLDLLARLAAEEGLAILLITHDLGVVATVCDRALVLSAGEAVEEGPSAELLRAPRHPATQRLVAAAPRLGRRSAP